MSTFSISSLYGGSISFVSSFDPAIDWEKSEISKKEYEADPIKFKTKIKFFEGKAPINIFLHHPTEEELMTAFQVGELDIDPESGAVYRGQTYAPGVGAVVGLSLAQQSLSTLCIDNVEGLDGWPTEAKAVNQFGLEELTKEAQEAFGPLQIRKAVMKEIGRYLMEATAPKGE